MPSHTTTRPTTPPTTQRAAGPGAALDTATWHWRNARPHVRALMLTPPAFAAAWGFTSLTTALIGMAMVAIGSLVASLATPRTRSWAKRQAADIPATIKVRYHWGWAMRQAEMAQPTRYWYRSFTGREERTPRVRQVRTQDDNALVITAEQLRGQGRLMWARARDELGNALERGLPTVAIDHDTRVVTITCPPGHGDPTKPTHIPVWHPEPPAAVPDLTALPVARDANGNTYHLPLLGRHVLVVGESGAGKGSVIWSILGQLAPAIRDGYVVVYGIDPKGGVELYMGAGLFTRLYSSEATVPGGRPWQEPLAAALEQAVADMQRRQERMRGRSRLHTPTRDEPLVIFVIDEFLSLTFGVTEPKLAKRIDASVATLLSQGRAVGYLVIGLTQAAQKEALGATIRDLFTLRVLLRVSEPDQVDMALGRGALKAGARAHEIPDKGAEGTGYVVTEGRTESRLIRFPWTTDEQLAQIAQTHRATRPTPCEPEQPAIPAPTEPGPDTSTDAHTDDDAQAPAPPAPVTKREALEAAIRGHVAATGQTPTAEWAATQVGCTVRYARRILAELPPEEPA